MACLQKVRGGHIPDLPGDQSALKQGSGREAELKSGLGGAGGQFDAKYRPLLIRHVVLGPVFEKPII